MLPVTCQEFFKNFFSGGILPFSPGVPGRPSAAGASFMKGVSGGLRSPDDCFLPGDGGGGSARDGAGFSKDGGRARPLPAGSFFLPAAGTAARGHGHGVFPMRVFFPMRSRREADCGKSGRRNPFGEHSGGRPDCGKPRVRTRGYR
jgi:hypothetical protein